MTAKAKDATSPALENLHKVSSRQNVLRARSSHPPTSTTVAEEGGDAVTTIENGFATTRIRVRRQNTEELEASMKAAGGCHAAPSFHVDVLKSFGGGADTSSAATVAAQVLIDVIGLDKLQARIIETLHATGVELPRYQVRFKDFTLAPKKDAETKDGEKGKRGKEGKKDQAGDEAKAHRTSAGASAARTPKNALLREISTCLNPGRFTLVMGPPGSGKSSLLKSIAGVVGTDSFGTGGQLTM